MALKTHVAIAPTRADWEAAAALRWLPRRVARVGPWAPSSPGAEAACAQCARPEERELGALQAAVVQAGQLGQVVGASRVHSVSELVY